MDKATFRPIQSQPISNEHIRKQQANVVQGNTFSHHFQQAIEASNKLVMSKHAKERLIERNIHISEEQWKQIEEKVQEAKRLGVKDSLVLSQEAAFIISAKNNTVITAMNRHEANAQIFTNITGTIVLE